MAQQPEIISGNGGERKISAAAAISAAWRRQRTKRQRNNGGMQIGENIGEKLALKSSVISAWRWHQRKSSAAAKWHISGEEMAA